MELLFLAVVSSVAVALGVALSHPSLRGAVRGALGVLLVLTLFAPFVNAVAGLAQGDFKLPDISYGDGGGFEEITLAAFEDGIAAALEERYGSSLTGVSVRVRGFNPREMRAEGVTVVLPKGAGMLDYREIRDYLDENFTRDGGSEVFYG